MEDILWLLLAAGAAYGCALAFPLMKFRSKGTVAGAAWCSVAVVLACPLLVPAHAVKLRAAAAFISTDLMFRMVDYFRRCRQRRHSFAAGEYYRFLIPFPVLLVVFAERKCRLDRAVPYGPEVARVLGGTAGCVAGWLLLALTWRSAALRASFPLDHVTIVVLFVLTIESISRTLYGLERLAGFDTTPIVHNAFLSRSVSEFWRRYNCRVHDWLYYNVFRTTGGRHAPVRGILSVFLVSALLHELMFDIATSSCDGYQLAFFLLQIPGVLASGPLERLARQGGIVGKLAAHGFTIVYMLATSVFFFHGVNKVFPIVYASEPWLP
jgi:hypothetical protein